MNRLLSALALSAISSFSHASLVERDLVTGSNDHHLTYDSVSGLEWLDVPLTKGRSFLEVGAGWGGYRSSGFRFATSSELRGLIQSSGLVENVIYDTYSGTGFAQDIETTKQLVLMLGVTFVYEDEGSPYQRRSVYGYLADKYSTSPGYESFGRYGDIGFYELGWTTRAWANDGSSSQVYIDSQYGEFGSFLVRTAVVSTVPEPSALALLFAGLGVLGFAWSRKESHC